MKTITRFLKFTCMMCFLLTTILFVSCSDDSDEDDNSSDNSKIVGVWQKTKEETRQGSEAWEDVTEDCDLDDTEEYVSDGDWALYPGTVTCGSANVINGSWELRANGTKVVYTYDGFQDEFESNIEELTAAKMVLTHSAGDIDDTQYRDTYVKQ
ncbi:lipocalin family protein [Flavobacterium sp. AG291]|uniref:lipocalin family protein n=1 Tax=Flavobacterium sp. AG291 TaxID=2184000 RepID=UPI000E0C5E9A|nr:lipocalin family protein [Flavobacterium sp. AG291]RDI06970.1 lipocalin-like protein [Flavobacterium sp. AG291]